MDGRSAGRKPMQPAPPRGPPPGVAKGKGKGGGYVVYDAYPPPHMMHGAPPAMMHAQPPAVNMEQVLSTFHDKVGNSVWECVQEVSEMMEGVDQDKKKCKQITKYMYTSASKKELMELPWQELCAEFVKGMWGSYASSCGELEWFYHIDLVPALTAGALVLLPAAGWRIPPNQVMDIMSLEFESNLDRKTLEKALWEMVENLYGDDEKVRTKMYRALSNSYDPALKAALADPHPMEDIQRVELFTSRWMDDATCRAWGGLQDQAQEVLNEESLVEMFDHLLRPFGDDHPFSAIPRVLTEGIGAPPRGWDFIPEAVQNLFAQWSEQENAPKKRKKKGGGDGDEVDGAEEESQPFTPAKKPRRAPLKKAAEGHAGCTSEADCAGSPEDDLVQHILEDGPGDIYCCTCWNSFKERNPDLEGVPVDD
jgi:hypothetical protein